MARVAMLAAVDGEYSYAVPPELAGQVEPGRRVLVPFGRNRKPQPAFCVAVGPEAWTRTLRPLAGVIDDRRLLDDGLLELGRWIARYYCCPLGRALAAMVPEAIRRQTGFRTVRILRLTGAEDPSPRRPAAREAVAAALRDHPEGLPLTVLLQRSGAGRGTVSAMLRRGLLAETTTREPAGAPDFDRPVDEPAFALNAFQQAAVDRIAALVRLEQFRAVLLFGVSGSGKTEVYVRAIRDTLAAGRQAILLVPEIALTTQIVQRLAGRFRDVAVIHSGLTGSRRSLTWAAIARGEKRVVIGTRSAVFAPCPALGLIVVDEEQEPSYKNLQSPRFHTREVAIKRAQMARVPVVLGSATPALETWHNCGRLPFFELIRLPERVAGLPMPEVRFVEMDQRQSLGVRLLSEPLEQALNETLRRGEQAVLLLNRRGYATYLVCGRCRTPVSCPHCRAFMVFHRTTGRAMCHHCGTSTPLPARCPDGSCGGRIARWGMGTQRLEEEVRARFPDARTLRADSDTMLRAADYEQAVESLVQRRIDVLIGTQMIAKGLDFPGVSLVGVVNADTSMAAADFRAAERTFQLIAQVAGRAGRAEAGGQVVVQSLMCDEPALRFAAAHDYEGFARHEIELRRRNGWPPFARLARVIVVHRSPARAERDAAALAAAVRDHLQTHGLAADVLGPQEAPLARLRSLYRREFLIRAADAARLMETMLHLRHHGVLTPMTRGATIDVDPVSFA